MLVVFLAIFTIIPVIFVLLGKMWKDNFDKCNIPGPPGVPILGNLPEFYEAHKKHKAFDLILELFKIYGDTFMFRILNTMAVITKDVKLQEIIANNPKFIKSDDYNWFKVWVGESLFVSHGERYQTMRKLLTPAFHFQILERFMQIYEEQSDVLVKKINETKDGVFEDAFKLFHAFALDVISESAIGVKINAQNDPNSRFVETNERIIFTIFERMITPLYHMDWIWKWTSTYKTQKEAIEYNNKFVNDLTEKRRNELLARNKNDDVTDEKPVFLDILLQSTMDGKPLTNDDIRGEVNTFMFGGTETTGSTLAFVFYLLAKHPEEQETLYEELKMHGFCNRTEPLTMRDINSLPYLDGTLKETLRMHSVAPAVSKKCMEEDLHYNGMLIPKGTMVVSAFHPNHMDEKYFENPTKFMPLRWSDEVSAKDRNPYAYQPFSAGLRNCIGQKFAVLEAKTVIAKIVTNFKVELADKTYEPDFILAFTIKTTNGMPLKFIKRE